MLLLDCLHPLCLMVMWCSDNNRQHVFFWGMGLSENRVPMVPKNMIIDIIELYSSLIINKPLDGCGNGSSCGKRGKSFWFHGNVLQISSKLNGNGNEMGIFSWPCLMTKISMRMYLGQPTLRTENIRTHLTNTQGLRILLEVNYKTHTFIQIPQPSWSQRSFGGFLK